jgi:hypothetical protein
MLRQPQCYRLMVNFQGSGDYRGIDRIEHLVQGKMQPRQYQLAGLA